MPVAAVQFLQWDCEISDNSCEYRYFHERAWLGLRQAFTTRPSTAITTTPASGLIVKPEIPSPDMARPVPNAAPSLAVKPEASPSKTAVNSAPSLVLQPEEASSLKQAVTPAPSPAVKPETPFPLEQASTAPLGTEKSPAEKADILNPGTIPKEPQGAEAVKLHEYKKEASSQQAP